MAVTPSGDITLDNNSTAPTGFIRPSATDFQTSVFILNDDDSVPSGDQNEGTPGYGLVLQRGRDFTLNSGVVSTASAVYLTNGIDSSATAAATVTIGPGATLTTPHIYTDNVLSTLDLPDNAEQWETYEHQAKLSSITIDGGQLITPRGRRAPWKSVVGNDGRTRWVTRNNAVILCPPNDVDGSGSIYGTGVPIFYFGAFSDMRDTVLRGFTNYEFQVPVLNFRNLSIQYPSGFTGESGGKGVLYQASGRGSFVIVPQGPTYEFVDSSNKPNSFKYFGLSSASSEMDMTDLPLEVNSWEIGFNTGSASTPSGQHNSYQRILLRGSLQAAIQEVSSSGAVVNSSGATVIISNKLFGTDTYNTTAAGLISADASYLWYEGWGSSFTNIGGRGATDLSMLVGWPDRTDGSGTELRLASSSQLSSIVTNINDTNAADSTSFVNNFNNAETNLKPGDYNSCTRYYPFHLAVLKWGFKPIIPAAALGGTAQLDSTPTKGEVVAANNTSKAVQSGYTVNGLKQRDLSADITSINTYAKANALTGFTYTNPTSSTGTLGISTDSTERSLTNLYGKTLAWVHNSANYNADNTVSVAAVTSSNRDDLRTFNIGGFSTSNGEIRVFTSNRDGQSNAQNLFNENNNRLNQAQSIQIHTNNASGTNTYPTGQNENAWVRYGLFYRESDNVWWIWQLTSPTTSNAGGSYNVAVVASSVDASTISLADNSNINIQWAQVWQKIPNVSVSNPRKTLLQNTSYNVALGNGTTIDCQRLAITGNLAKDTNFTKLALDQHSSLALSNNTLKVDVERLGTSGTPTVNGFSTSSSVTSPCIANGVTVGANVRLEFAGGQTYYIAGDISAATLVRTGSGNATLVFVGSGVGPSSATNFTLNSEITITFEGAHNWANTAPAFHVENFSAAVGTTLIASSAITRDADLSGADNNVAYRVRVSPGSTVRYAFAARQSDGGTWYAPIEGSTSVDVSMPLTSSGSSIATAAGSEEGASAHETHLKTDGDSRVPQLTSAAAANNKLIINVAGNSVNGTDSTGRFITRLAQQQTNFVNAVAQGYYSFANMLVRGDRVVYEDGNFVQWAKPSSATNIVRFDTQTLDSSGVGVNAVITTTNAQTEVRWLGNANIIQGLGPLQATIDRVEALAQDIEANTL